MALKVRAGRKLLVASIGVATMSYVAYSCSSTTTPGSGGDAASDAADTNAHHDVVNDFPVANLVAPPVDVIDDFPVANLVAPPVDAHD